MEIDEKTPMENQFRIGRLEAQAESLLAAVTRVEAKIDAALIRHDERIRAGEGELMALRRLGAIVAVLWGTIIAGIAYLFQQYGR